MFESVTTVTTRDAAALLEVVAEGVEAAGPEAFPPVVLAKLAELVPADASVGYQEADVTGRHRVVELVEVVGEPVSRALEEAYVALGHQNPHCCRVRARERRVLRLSDSLSPRARRRLDYYASVWRPLGIEDDLRLWLPAPPGRARSIYLERTGPFSDRERTLLTLLRPHLLRIRQLAEARRLAHGLPELTPREREVLGLVAVGRTNREIGTMLWISPHTVRTHLANVFEKLGVHTRTAAVARLRAAARHPDAVVDSPV
jgi:DNA-binding CsgD family transcriptional regulator